VARSRTAGRALAARRLREPEQQPAGTTRASRPVWPARISHDELDRLASRHGVVFGEGATKAQKQAALDDAGVTPEG
jgi:hypothetical protein